MDHWPQSLGVRYRAVARTRKIICPKRFAELSVFKWKSQPVIGKQNLTGWSQKERPEGKEKTPWPSSPMESMLVRPTGSGPRRCVLVVCMLCSVEPLGSNKNALGSCSDLLLCVRHSCKIPVGGEVVVLKVWKSRCTETGLRKRWPPRCGDCCPTCNIWDQFGPLAGAPAPFPLKLSGSLLDWPCSPPPLPWDARTVSVLGTKFPLGTPDSLSHSQVPTLTACVRIPNCLW